MLNDGETSGRLFARLKQGLSKTHEGFINRVERLVLRRNRVDEDLLESLEELYIQGDIGPRTTMDLMDGLRRAIARNEVTSPESVFAFLRRQAAEALAASGGELHLPAGGPAVILVVGTNGSGKTTTVAKLGSRLQREGRKVILAAADTFRAAASEQLEVWGRRAGLDVISQESGSDPSAVVFDTLRAAQARGHDVVIVDTAGRLHTKTNLMDELKKIQRIMGRELPGAPHETLMVLDATTGQNALVQAQMFNAEIGITGLVLTKLDGTAKGGIVIRIADEMRVPIRYIGIGEKVDDLRPFNSKDFVEALFAED